MMLDLIAKQLEWRNNPELFIKEVIDDSPRWSAQLDILHSVRDNRNTLVKSPHGMGKSFTSKDVVLWFLFSFTNSIVITTAPSWGQVEGILWAELNQSCANMKIKDMGLQVQKTRAGFTDKWFAKGISPKVELSDQAARITGFHAENLLVVFDEGPSVHGALWKYKETLLTSANCHFLAIGNPIKSEGAFYEAYNSPNVSKIHIDLFESPNFKANKVTFKKLKELAKMDYAEREKVYKDYKTPFPFLTTPMWAIDRAIEWGIDSPMFEARVLGEFPRKVTDTIIAYSELEAVKNIEPVFKTGRILGVDVARFGDDSTCVIGYENGIEFYREKWQGQDLVKTANTIINVMKEYKIHCVVIDDTGLGGGVTDMINTYIAESIINCMLIPVNFAEKAGNDDLYNGIVTEMFFLTRDLIRNKKIQVKDTGYLFSDISGRKYVYDNTGRYRIEKKDDFKKRVGRSPDEGDAFILCCYGMTRPRHAGSGIVVGDSEVLKHY